jgi:DUF3040 family protein
VPLSEDEQRILAEIEQQFYREDPVFAQQVGETTLYRHASRNVKWAVLGLLVSLVFTLVVFTRGLLLGLVGFLLMSTCAFFLYQNLRKLGRASYDQISQHVQARGISLRGMFGRAGRRMRGRFGDRRGDD